MVGLPSFGLGRGGGGGYAGGFFTLSIDPGNANENIGYGDEPAFIRSIDGGFLQGSVISETLGADLHQVKHLGTVDIQPINVETGLASSKTLLEWISETWQLKASKRSGRIEHGAPTGGAIRSQFAQEFRSAYLTEVTFPAMSGDAKSESVYLKATIQPGELKQVEGDNSVFQHVTRGRQLEWAKAACSLEIGNTEIPLKKIDAFTIKQQVKKLYTGRSREVELVAAGIELANLAVYTNQLQSDYLYDWYVERLERGTDEIAADREGALIYHNQAGDELFRINFHKLGIYSFGLERSTAGETDLKVAKAGLYVESVDLELGVGLD